jgi:phosphoesterase RecJ-like protein
MLSQQLATNEGGSYSVPVADPPAELLRFLEDYDTYYLVGHIEPDGDCLASSLTLGSYLRRRGKRVRHLNEGPFFRQEVKRFQEHFETELSPEETEAEHNAAAVVLDCSTPERVGNLGPALRTLPVAVIDHHSAGEPYGDVTYIVPAAPATSLLVQKTIEATGSALTREEAEHALFALSTDTGFFRHLDAGSDTAFHATARLVAAGASPKRVFDMIYGGKTLASRRLMARVMARTETLHDGRYLITYETAADTAEFGRENRDTDTLYQLLMGTRECEAIALLREETESSCTGSLRSDNDIDVGAIAQRFGGGGHKRAAGFLVERPWRTVMSELKEIFDRIHRSR